LNETLDESHDSVEVSVGLDCLEEQVQVHGLL
jgi:hypothetical protein